MPIPERSMALSVGTRLGSYEILNAIGAGGMGEVYRARDTRLGRNIALKILPELFAADADRLARFQREAQVLASLNHPNKRIMVAAYTAEDDSFHVEKPRLWSERSFVWRPRQRHFDLHPDGDRVALAALPEGQTLATQDKVVFIFNFFEELKRIAPVTKR